MIIEVYSSVYIVMSDMSYVNSSNNLSDIKVSLSDLNYNVTSSIETNIFIKPKRKVLT